MRFEQPDTQNKYRFLIEETTGHLLRYSSHTPTRFSRKWHLMSSSGVRFLFVVFTHEHVGDIMLG